VPLHYTRRLSPMEIEAAQATLVAVNALRDYTPTNRAYGTEAVAALAEAMDQAHESILGVKRQVLAQYGPDADALHAVGLKKRAEKRRPARRKAA
jgi:hypothetical protein